MTYKVGCTKYLRARRLSPGLVVQCCRFYLAHRLKARSTRPDPPWHFFPSLGGPVATKYHWAGP